MNILVVDDNDVTAGLTCELMELVGHGATGAYSSEGALRAVSAEAFDVALLDLGPPDLSRTDLAVHLRDAFPRMALIAITTGFPLHGVQRSHSGVPLFDEVLQKPVEFAALETFLTQIAERLGKTDSAQIL